MGSDLDFRFDLMGAGWADVTVRVGDRTHLIDGVSYLTDAFGDFVRCGVMLATGAFGASVRFDGEPIETYLAFDADLEGATGANDIRLSCFQHYGAPPRSLAALRRDPAALLFAEPLGDANGVATAILACAESVLAQHGVNGFKSGWIEHDFPMGAVRTLRAALG